MLEDLLMVDNYFEPHARAFYEADLVERYGQNSIMKAVRNGDLEHRWLPCGQGRRRCVVWLSEQGRKRAMQ